MLAIFDFLVCATASWAFLKSRRADATDVLAPAGYLLIAAAALVGTLRYALFPQLAPLHQWASACAAVYGVPAIAAGFFLTAEEVRERKYFHFTAFALLVPAFLLFRFPLYALLVGILAEVSWLFAALRFHRVNARLPQPIIVSVVLISIAGILFDKPGLALGIRNENWFHGLLAIGVWQQSIAFRALRRSI